MHLSGGSIVVVSSQHVGSSSSNIPILFHDHIPTVLYISIFFAILVYNKTGVWLARVSINSASQI